jgi:prolyl-tRNA synthetase
MKDKSAITPTREENYPEWYQQVIKAADLAENAPVRGCMVIKPDGYALWENMQRILDAKFKETGHKNACFPLLIPLGLLEKEADHVEGFAKECAVVTHHRLEKGEDGKLIPAGKLEEPYIIRPTSETIIGVMFAKWVASYRDLPLLINQWANVVRWEMRTRMFLRTAEFLWQEGHTAHATESEAIAKTKQMLDIYEEFCRKSLALPVIKGTKTDSERFPGAVATYCFEGMMQDRKALQGGTSHFLGQNFAKAAGIEFQDPEGNLQNAWTTSWGVTTRLIGSVIMTHSDDDGFILPPRIASTHVVILPILHKEETREAVLTFSQDLAKSLRGISYFGQPLQVNLDDRDMRGGEKTWSWIKKGIPLRVEIGPRDVESGKVCLKVRTKGHKEAIFLTREEFIEKVPALLDEVHDTMYEKALAFREKHTHKIDSKEEFYKFFTPKNRKNPEIHGGFAFCHWSGEEEVEEIVKKDLNVTIRCIPLDSPEEDGVCIISGKKSRRRVIFAKSY